ncbi:hypothetical protein TNIN_242841 [Trichonephila inaurata madagascariensis]|uniref:Uncharacterized protein n=1 Tax=Trichonephila inaurata madagascariensis TaxID=2747483 RepID=A0A8X7CV05_9ARAC|nr:hypothetical protein TNIN_242841 [Trichonephila inaurata madagascariensis]
MKVHVSHCAKKSSSQCAEENQSSDSMVDEEVDQPPVKIQCLEEKYDCQVKSIESDYAKNMEKMWHELEQKFETSTLITYGCGAHWLNLLGKDVTSSSFMKHVVDIHNERPYQRQLKPVASALAHLESDSATFADACHVWCKLLNHNELKPHSAVVKKRFEQAILDWHILAYLLLSKYRGENLNYEQKERTRECLRKLNPLFISYAINFEM